MPKGETVNGVYLFHGENEKVKPGYCKVKGHYGPKWTKIFGTINGVRACTICIDNHHKLSITWGGEFG